MSWSAPPPLCGLPGSSARWWCWKPASAAGQDSTNIVKDTLGGGDLFHRPGPCGGAGDTPAKIAAEKCGVLRPGIPCICYPDQDLEALAVIMEKAAEQNCRLIQGNLRTVEVERMTLEGTDLRYRDLSLHLPLVGRYQLANCVNAVEALLALRAGHEYPGQRHRPGHWGDLLPGAHGGGQPPPGSDSGRRPQRIRGRCPVRCAGGAGPRPAGDPHRHDEG